MQHYTSVEGFNQIIKNKSLRMTKSEFLNDPFDCKLFYSLISEYLTRNQDKVKTIINQVSKETKLKEFYNKYTILDYFDYVQKEVTLYVLSLTELSDNMSMWNYYGHGGVEFSLDTEPLIKSITGNFKRDDEFLCCSKVFYVDSDCHLENISLPLFEEFNLRSRTETNIFFQNKEYLTSQKQDYQLYSTKYLNIFIDTYFKNYVYTLNHLIMYNEIDFTFTKEEVFKKVFNNINKLYSKYIWKRDLSLYILVLSALIKSKTYEYENEYRIVYFQHNIDEPKEKTEHYYVKNIDSNKYLHPYISFDNIDLENSISKITISPTTKNLPIDNNIYLSTIKSFINNHNIHCNDICFSEHKIRW